MKALCVEATPAAAGDRLDHFLAEPLGSRARAQQLIAAGRVTVDGHPALKRHRLRAGERVCVALPAPPETPGLAPEAASLGLAFEDEHLLVVDKPAGLVVHPGRGHPTGTLAQVLAGRARGGAVGRAGIVHRLDRDTSGLLVVARSELVHRRLQEQLARRELIREYLALVEGFPPARTGTIDAPVGRDRRNRLRISTDTDHPRPARTHFAIERALATTTLLRVRLETGRTHQIRVHLLAIGHPVCGDPQYGHAGSWGLRRQFLHAHRLAFKHPVTGAQLDLHSGLPDDLAAALQLAERGV